MAPASQLPGNSWHVPTNLHTSVRTLIELDGSWLSDDEEDGDEEEDTVRTSRKHDEDLRRTIRSRRSELQKLLDDVTPQARVRLGRTPPLAILRADADQLGKLQGTAIRSGGLAKATELSQILWQDVLSKATSAIEGACRGRVLFAGGDELLALLPASHGLRAAEAVVCAFRDGAKGSGFPELSCTVAVVVVAAHRPLRGSIEELGRLLDSAKSLKHRTPLFQSTSSIARRVRRNMGVSRWDLRSFPDRGTSSAG